MPDILKMDFSGGLVTAKDRADLGPGELQNATGITYRRNDRRAWQLKGRTVFGEVVAANAVKGLKLCQFDSGGTDRLVALTGSSLYAAPDPAATGAFAADAVGRSAQAEQLHGVHLDNKWFLSTGQDSNTVLDADGNYRTMGMISPQASLVPVPVALGQNTTRPTANTNDGFTDPEDAYDADADSYAYSYMKAPGETSVIYSGWASNADTDRYVIVRYFVAAAQFEIGDSPGGVTDQFNAGFDVTVKFELSQDGGLTYGSVPVWSEETFLGPSFAISHLQKSIAGGGAGVDSDAVFIKVTLTYNSGDAPMSLRIYDIIISNGSAVAPFDTTTGMRYAVAEESAIYGIKSAIGPISAVIEVDGAGASEDAVQVPLHTARNPSTTHYLIYRTPDGGSAPKQLGLVGRVPVAEAAETGMFIDRFSPYIHTEQPLPITALKIIRRGTTELAFPRDSRPPLYTHIGKFKGVVVGVNGRTLWFSEPGLPESVPEINRITDFEMEERDQLVGTMQISDTLWIGMTDAVLFIDDLPEVQEGQLVLPPKRALSGFPGCPSTYGFTTYEEQGTPRGAWVSRHGIYATDGFRGMLLTGDLDWTALVSEANLSSAVLHWDQRQSILTFAYASGSDGNDRYIRLHMDDSHKKGGMPKISGPHYGKINCMESGETGGTYRTWTGHPTDGKVYLEESGVLDKSKAYDGTNEEVRLDVTPGRLYTPKRDLYSLNTGSLKHTAATGGTVELTVTTGRDDGDTDQSVTKTAKLDGHKGTEFFVGRAGEWSEVRIVGGVRADWALHELNFKARAMSKAGTVLT